MGSASSPAGVGREQSGGAARAGRASRLDGAAELLDRIAQRLPLEPAADESREPEAEVDALRAGRDRAARRVLEAIRSLHVLHVTLDQLPRRTMRRVEGVVEHVADRLDGHVEHELDPLRQSIGPTLEHAAARDRRRPSRVVLERGENGEALGDGSSDRGRVRLAILAHGLAMYPAPGRRVKAGSRAGDRPDPRSALFPRGRIRYAPTAWRCVQSNGETAAW